MTGRARVLEPPIRVVAGIVVRSDGRMLLVRKQGTQAFMQPGGKREPGETDQQALAREIQEELGAQIVDGSVRHRGCFCVDAANEPGRRLEAELYWVELSGHVQAAAEIAEIVWVNTEEARNYALAPLTKEHVLPMLDA